MKIASGRAPQLLDSSMSICDVQDDLVTTSLLQGFALLQLQLSQPAGMGAARELGHWKDLCSSSVKEPFCTATADGAWGLRRDLMETAPASDWNSDGPASMIS